MMKKIRMIVILFILTFSFSVKAEIFMEFDCGNKSDITPDKTLTCEGNFLYEEISISDIEFEYETNLDITFTEVSGFPLTKSGNKISIHANTPLYDEILNGTVIVRFTLSANDNSKEKESLTFNNFKINKSNEIEVEEVSETFNVTVPSQKPLDSDCLLNSITIDTVMVPSFDKNKFEYSGIVVSSNVVFIDAIRSSEKSSATGLGQVDIDPGKTITHIITVTAEDNTKKEYKLTITNKSDKADEVKENNIEPTSDKEKEEFKEEVVSKDNTLKTLELYHGKNKIDFIFDNKKDVFNIKIDEEIETLTIKATLSDKDAKFVSQYGPRDVKLNFGDNKVLIKTKALDNSEKTYTLNINVKDNRDKDNFLKSLKINNEVINLVDKIYQYEITVNKTVEKLNIEAIATSDKAKVEYKDIDLSFGDNKVIISVTAENNDKRDYTINVIKSEEDEVDNSLQNIAIDGYDLGFTKDKKDYVLKISHDTDSLRIILKPSNLEYEILGNENLSDGSVITIKVADETEYKINIQKDSNKISSIIYIIGGVIALSLIIGIIYLIKRKKNSIEII